MIKLLLSSVLIILLTGCVTTQHICLQAEEGEPRAYCYAQTTLQDLIKAADASRLDGSLSPAEHHKFISIAREADAYLDQAFLAMYEQRSAAQYIILAKEVLKRME